ncbi:ABC-type transport auxiliary lipoprotein family protein [Lysobacter solisilvae (ex Woo and Kim 2020)]|uniref:Membrane integrity-associated transporter subunit PqiC n=1 Tax=Agrilutibacter terrestris TaxID=2865112 RepID=A0A7H0FZE6_9GAMM|nr:ABC-type transport auxiliary lipoprotein family protein [Lysobacter terrestris]QNP41412.1 membrane integrity-associated transporter subunit PqiC [Lysobacter terrestris]
MKTGSRHTSCRPRRAGFRSAALLAPLLLAGCSSLLGGGTSHSAIYAPDVRVADTQGWPQVRWRLAMGRTSGIRIADSQRIMVRPTPNELQVYKDAQWAKSPGDMLEDSVLHALEDSGRIAVVARQGSGFGADYRLMLDIRRFESDYAGTALPSATIEVTAKLLHVKDQQLAGSHTFRQARPAATTAVPDVVAAFDEALAAVTGELAGWTLTTGEQYERARR